VAQLWHRGGNFSSMLSCASSRVGRGPAAHLASSAWRGSTSQRSNDALLLLPLAFSLLSPQPAQHAVVLGTAHPPAFAAPEEPRVHGWTRSRGRRDGSCSASSMHGSPHLRCQSRSGGTEPQRAAEVQFCLRFGETAAAAVGRSDCTPGAGSPSHAVLAGDETRGHYLV